MKTLVRRTACFLSHKGGVGKTSSVQNVGACLARSGKRVLLIDMDPQANLAISFGIDPYGVAHDAGDFCLGQASFEQVVVSAENGAASRLSIIPASDRLSDSERVLQGKNMYHKFLRKQLASIPEGYDYCLIDCPPALGTMTVNALYASDYFFVPLQAEYLAYEGIRKILSFTTEVQEEIPLKFGGVFATRYHPNERRRLSRELIETTARQLGDRYMADCYIRVNTAISEAQAAGEDIFSYAPTSNAAADYERLTREIVRRMNHG